MKSLSLSLSQMGKTNLKNLLESLMKEDEAVILSCKNQFQTKHSIWLIFRKGLLPTESSEQM